MKFIQLKIDDTKEIENMSKLASSIVKQHFDPIIGPKQNDYMIEKFQSVESIYKQLQHGYRYYFVEEQNNIVGFLAIYPKEHAMYLSKFYLKNEERKKGYARKMMAFIIEETKKQQLPAIELNVNKQNDACQIYEKIGFKMIREEKNDIGHGFYMDDYVYRLDL